jgi:curved DNA-binding protein CbpA
LRSLYRILGIKKSATNEEIKKAYYELAKIYHPDIPETGNEIKFKKIKDAYETLMDENKRSAYDKTGISPGSHEESLYSIVIEMFKKGIWEDIDRVRNLDLLSMITHLNSEINNLSEDIEKVEEIIQKISEYNGLIYRSKDKKIVKIDCFSMAIDAISAELNVRHKQLLSTLSLKKKLVKILSDYEQKRPKYEVINRRKKEDLRFFKEYRSKEPSFVGIFTHFANERKR